MSRSLLSQLEQIAPSFAYDATLNPLNAQTQAQSLEDDLNFIRSQLKAITGQTEWFAAPLNTQGATVDLKDLADRTNIDAKAVLESIQMTNIAVVGGSSYLDLPAITVGMAVDVDSDETLSAYAAKHLGGSDATSSNMVELRAFATGDPIDAGDGFKLFGKLEVVGQDTQIPAGGVLIDGVATMLRVVFYKKTASGGIAPINMPAGVDNVDLMIRRQVSLGSIMKDQFVSDVKWFDVAQEANIGNLNFNGDSAGNGRYVETNKSVTYNLDKLDARAWTNAQAIGTINTTDLANLRLFVGSDGQGDDTPDYVAAVGTTGLTGVVARTTIADGSSLEAAIGVLRNVAENLQGQISDLSGGGSGSLGALQTELDDTQLGAGLAANGAYAADETTNYLKAADFAAAALTASLKSADKLLDAAIKAVRDDLASTAAGKGAALVAIEDSAGRFDATTVEGALAELDQDRIQLVADLANTANAMGASLIGVEDAAGHFANATVEAVLAEIGQAIEDMSPAKAVTALVATVDANGFVTVPEYTVAVGGANLDVYYQGQLLAPGAGNDYVEVGVVGTKSTTIQALFTMRSGNNLLTVVRK